MILLVRVVLVVSLREPFSCFFFCSNHLFYCSSEFFIVSRIFFAEVLKLPPSHDSVRESFNYFSFGDVMHLSPQFTESPIVISETFAPLLLESFQFGMSDRVCDDTYEILTESSLQVFPSSDRSWVQFIKPLEGHRFQCHGEEQGFNIIVSSG